MNFEFMTIGTPLPPCMPFALLKEASRLYEQTIVMITHSQSIAQTADRILRVSDGVVTDFGRCRE